MAKFIIALEEGTDDEIVDAYITLGAKSQKMDRQWLLCSAFLDFDSCYGNAALKRIGLEDFTLPQTIDFMLSKD